MQRFQKDNIKNNITFQSKDISKLLFTNFPLLMSGFCEMQSSFLTGIYKRYKSIETSNILMCLEKNTQLEILRLREKNLDHDISFKNFWHNLNDITRPAQKIISIAKATGLPKETARRKIKELILKNFIRINNNSKEYYWNPLSEHKENYINFVNKEIGTVSKFVYLCSEQLNLSLSKDLISILIESQFSFYWYHFLSCQLLCLKMWQDKIKDVELILITLQAIIPTLQYVSKHKKVKDIDLDKLYLIIEKTSDNYKSSSISISATSISDITGIPRATCARKLEKLLKLGLLEQESKSKRFFISQLALRRTKNIITKENVNFTVKTFSDCLSIILNALIKINNGNKVA